MTDSRAILAIVIISAVTILIRFAPFLLLAGRETPKTIEYLGRVLPYAIMGMLVVYCLKDMSFSEAKEFVPEFIACAFVVISYACKRSTLLSIVGGTVCYMLLIQLVFV